MKRYLFLKLGLTILMFAAVSARNQVTENVPPRDVYRNSNNQNSDQTDERNVRQQADPKIKSEELQGVMGKPGVDFPILTYIPRTGFSCKGKKSGYYADLDTNCQVFHICEEGRKVSFLCPNGTIFQQSDLICDWWFKVDCATAPTLYDESAEQFYEETLRRKENRRVFEQERRAVKRKQNFVKKDTQNFEETQVPSETASFVNRYNSEQQKKFIKSLNDVTTNEFSNSFRSTTEKIVSRGSRTYSQNHFSSQYKSHLADVIKTTTQHTIYSPTIPPFTTKYTTKVPPTTTYKIKNHTPGFYITTNLKTSTISPDIYTTNVPEKLISTTDYYSTINPLVGSEFVTGNSEYGTTLFEVGNTVVPSIPTPFKTSEEKRYLPKISTPKPTQPTEYTTLNIVPTVTDNLNNMIKTLEDLDNNPNINIENKFGTRPGLNIPPSAGPKTLHSLAVYFATALDNLVSNNDSETTDKEELSTVSSVDKSEVTLLSRTTQNKYNNLFDLPENSTESSGKKDIDTEDVDLKSLVEHDAQFNDLDGEQSRGPVSSTPRIRQLAQVFTQALSAYLDDPDTFKKVLEEIRPTEPPLDFDIPSTTEYTSYTKEEDEVLDFSDADKSSTYRPYTDNIKTTQTTFYRSTTKAYLNEIPSGTNNNITKRIPTPNSLALDLNNGLKISNNTFDEESTEDTTQSDDYYPFNTGEDLEDVKLKATAKPYGEGVKPENSTPISLVQRFGLELSDSLLPPFKISLLNKKEYNNTINLNDEYLQSAHSQSFVSHNRKSKQFNFDATTTDIPDTTTYYETTTTDISTTDSYTSTTIPTTMETEQTTISKGIPNNHWSTSPEVTKLWENTLYVDPQIINRNLEDEPTTYRPELSTVPYKTTTDFDDIDLRFTEDPTTTTDLNIYTTYYDLGIHSLLNNTELEIASSQAQQIFGNLNSTEQDLLIEKMKEAESNSTVRRLILLLVSTCDASLSNNKTVQETRNTILQALLNLPSNEKIETNRVPKQLPIETTVLPEITSQDTKFQNKVNDIKDVNHDARALELLRSLYSLAAKWGKK